jgi:TetR/AcrR family transcriptional regulator
VVSAGVTKPTLYHHFGSKQGVLETLLVERADPAIADLATAASYHGDLPLTLGTVVDTMFAFGQREPELYWMLVAANITATDDAANQLLASRLRARSISSQNSSMPPSSTTGTSGASNSWPPRRCWP